jgi:hypothetical protein
MDGVTGERRRFVVAAGSLDEFWIIKHHQKDRPVRVTGDPVRLASSENQLLGMNLPRFRAWTTSRSRAHLC